MIGFLKRWFATRNDLDDMQAQLDTIANAVQDLRKEQLIRREAERDAWRPVKKASKNTLTKTKAKK